MQRQWIHENLKTGIKRVWVKHGVQAQVNPQN